MRAVTGREAAVRGEQRGRGARGVPAAPAADPARQEPTLPVAAVARRLGVAPATLRTWDRRYGLGPSGHTGGKHRRYSPEDIACLEVMQRALLSGASTAEAARFALQWCEHPGAAPQRPPEVPWQPVSRDADHLADAGRSAVSAKLARRLSVAALATDARTVQQVLADALAAVGPVRTWEYVVLPVLSAVGVGWRNSRSGAEAGYLLADLAAAAFARRTPLLSAPRNHHPVLLASAPTERASLPLHALAAGLAQRDIDPLPLTSPLPADVLLATVRRTAPAAVVLWSQRTGSDNVAVFTTLAKSKQRSRLFACGPGWEGVTLPPVVEVLAGVGEVVERVSSLLLGAPR